MITVHPETLQHRSDGAFVDITIGADRRTVRCFHHHADTDHARLDLYGIAVRFQTGTKVWPGSACYWFKTGNVNNVRPNIDKRGSVSVVGYAEDFAGKPVRSRHNAVAPAGRA